MPLENVGSALRLAALAVILEAFFARRIPRLAVNDTVARRARARVREALPLRVRVRRALIASYRPSRPVLAMMTMGTLGAMLLNGIATSERVRSASAFLLRSVVSVFPSLAFIEMPMRAATTLIRRGALEQASTIEVQAALVSVAVAIVILIAERFGGVSSLAGTVVFLRESMAFPLLCASVALLLISLVSPGPTVYTLALTFLVGIWTIYSLYRLVAANLDPFRFARIQEEAEREQARAAARSALLERAGEVELARVLAPLRMITTAPLFTRAGRTHFRAWRSGYISDVRPPILKKLDAFLTTLRIGRDGRVEAVDDGVRGETTVSGSRRPACYLRMRFGQRVDQGDTLLVIDNALDLSQRDRKSISSLLHDAVVISQDGVSVNAFEAIVARIRRDFVSSTRRQDYDGALAAVRRVIALVEEYLRLASELGAVMNQSSARREAQLLVGRLPVGDEAPRAVLGMIRASLRGQEREIAAIALELPTALARIGAEWNDQLVVHSFIRAHAALLEMYYDDTPVRPMHRRLLFERSWRGLRDTALVVLAPLEREASDDAAVQSAAEAGRTMLLQYQEMVRLCLRSGTVEELNALLAIRKFIVPEEIEELLARTGRAMWEFVGGEADGAE